MALSIIGVDADDTLWHTETVFRLTHKRFNELLADFADEEAWAKHQCGRAYQAQLQRYARCGEASKACAEAPRMVLLGAAKVAAMRLMKAPSCPPAWPRC